MTKGFIYNELRVQDIPLTIEVLHPDTREVVWATTVTEVGPVVIPDFDLDQTIVRVTKTIHDKEVSAEVGPPPCENP